jgi:3-hydroxyacyl-CoA dehydrogenase/3a,7a,12a-trihydroxy-5b-cholest-24-enoyl-CoA hydratase
VGASTSDPYALNYLYENSDDFRVLPTFPVIPALPCMFDVMKNPNLNVDFTRILHGEQYIELHRPMPQEGEIKMKIRVIDVMDKISGAVYIIEGIFYFLPQDRVIFFLQ